MRTIQGLLKNDNDFVSCDFSMKDGDLYKFISNTVKTRISGRSLGTL